MEIETLPKGPRTMILTYEVVAIKSMYGDRDTDERPQNYDPGI
jgi:hypothetical protein